MHIKDLHPADGKGVSARPLSRQLGTKAMAIRILKGGLLPEHITKVPAALVCVVGEVEYEDEKGRQIRLRPGDFHEIEPMVKHWVRGLQDSQLVLIR